MLVFRNIFIFLILLILKGNMMSAQTAAGTITGRVTDEYGPFQYVTVVLQQHGKSITAAITDEDGRYSLAAPEAGVFEVKCSFAGLQKTEKRVKVSAGESRELNVFLSSGTETAPLDSAALQTPLIMLPDAHSTDLGK